MENKKEKRTVVRIVPGWQKSYEWDDETAEKNLNLVSPSFCAAKWKQTTVHLQNGHTHSCHHPGTHKIPLEELEVSSSALHNTHHKFKARDEMKAGIRPAECTYCWKVEDSGGISDRVHKSKSIWAGAHVKDLATTDAVTDHPPSYLEVSFGNVCNFKCAYCAPHISSKWMEEIKQHGPYPTTDKFNNLDLIENRDQMPIPNNQPNPYVDAFWDYFPKIASKLLVLRVTGGEPLLNKNTFKLLDWLIENPQPNLTLSINTNLNVPKANLDRALSKLAHLEKNEYVQELEIHTSAEGGKQASEYIRFGMNYKEWKKNLQKCIMTLPKSAFNIMSTFNVCSFGTYEEFLTDMKRLKELAVSPLWKATGKFHPRLSIDVPYLRNPSFLSMFVLQHPDFNSDWFLSQLDKFVNIAIDYEFSTREVNMLKRLKSLLVNDKGTILDGTNFVAFVDEYDKRRDTNFKETFPELVELYNFHKSRPKPLHG